MWSVNGGQSVQVCHGELQPPSPQVVIYVHHTHQGGRATKRISPRLWVGMRKYDENVPQHSTQAKTKTKNKKSKRPPSI